MDNEIRDLISRLERKIDELQQVVGTAIALFAGYVGVLATERWLGDLSAAIGVIVFLGAGYYMQRQRTKL
jgi:hypothetical protein